MSYETLIVDQTGPIATITLNRPEARNALDFAMRRELLTALDEIEANPAGRVVILTGAGGHFCAGGDVKNMRQRHTAAEGQARVELLNRAVLRLVNFPLPTIAMVDGYAVGTHEVGRHAGICPESLDRRGAAVEAVLADRPVVDGGEVVEVELHEPSQYRNVRGPRLSKLDLHRVMLGYR